MTQWDLLKKMRKCNWQTLAKDLGVSPQTLKSWRDLGEQGYSAGKNADLRAHQLFHATLAQHNCEWISLHNINWDAIATIGGRK